MGITDYISRHPAVEAQKMDDYEEKFVVNRIKNINRQIGTGYSQALNRLIRRQTKNELLEEQRQLDYAKDENAIMERVNKRAREINQRLFEHWSEQLPPLDHSELISNNINNTNCERINKINEQDMESSYSGGVEGIEERIDELHRSIAKLRRPGKPEEIRGPVLSHPITLCRKKGGK